MKQIFFLLMFSLLVNSETFAQTAVEPDLTAHPGAKAILDDMRTHGFQAIKLEQAVKEDIENGTNIYTKENVIDLVQAAGKIKDLPISLARDYVNKAEQIFSLKVFTKQYDDYHVGITKIIMNSWKDAVEKKPLVALSNRLENYGYTSLEDYNNTSDENKIATYIIKSALWRLEETRDFSPYAVMMIVGTPDNEFEDGLLYIAFKMIEKFPDLRNVLEGPAKTLQLVLLCDNKASESAYYFLSESDLLFEPAKAIVRGLSEETFSADNKKLKGIIKEKDISKGLKNFKRITKLLAK